MILENNNHLRKLIHLLLTFNNSFSLKSYKVNDLIYIKDKILNYSYYEEGPTSIITFDCENETYRQLPILIYQDKRDEYKEGSIVTMPVHVREYTVEGKNVVWLEEWHNVYKSFFIG